MSSLQKFFSFGLLGKKKKKKKDKPPEAVIPPSLFSPPHKDTGEALAEKTVLGGF